VQKVKTEQQIRQRKEEIQKLNESNQMLWLDTYIDALNWVLEKDDAEKDNEQ
jgi:hypothetical protein